MKLSASERGKLPAKDFAGPGRSFPIENASHARDAISGAVRAWHAGHISEGEMKHIIHEARAKLGEGDFSQLG